MLLVSPMVSAQETARPVDFRFTLQTDFRRFPTEPGAAPHPTFDLRRARIGIEGTLWTRLEYQVEHDLENDATPWADVYANVTLPHGMQLRAGRFKVPFGLEQLTAARDVDFVYRTLTSDYLTPGRDIGAMVHGGVFGKQLKYQFGVFRAGGDNTQKSERAASPNGRTFSGRLVFKPWDRPHRAGVLSKLALGLAATSGGIPEGTNSVRGHDFADDSLFHDVYVNGRRHRLGGELEWRYGSTAIRAERMWVADQRRGEGIDDEDLPDAVAEGWYLSGTWIVTGEKKTDHVKPDHPLLRGGIGAIEAVARIEDFRFGSRPAGEGVSRDPRARVMAEDADRAVTGGVNWYPVRRLKLQFALIRERIERRGVLVQGRTPAWARILRLQVAL
jgi:phosphate-selective porin OprO/OprP